jgi:hypothetical protein
VSTGVTEEDSGCELAVFSPLVTLAHVGVVCEGGQAEGQCREVIPPLAVLTQGEIVCEGVRCLGEYICWVLTRRLNRPTTPEGEAGGQG